MNKINFRNIMLAALACIVAMPTAALAGEARHVNFAAFQKEAPGFEFEAIVLGKFSDFIEAMEGSQVLLLGHTDSAVDGDVINIQQDVLREANGSMGDYGINCSLSFKVEGPTDYLIGGLCKIIRTGRGGDMKLTAIIPPANLPDTAQGIDAWVELYEDEKTGIAFYANVSSGH